ncbi:MAG: class I SAM-dependent methyltransferase [Maritimibacter sp.]|nr:class I SAM-dependent methyltransferase [Maritimibacter sp.]
MASGSDTSGAPKERPAAIRALLDAGLKNLLNDADLDRFALRILGRKGGPSALAPWARGLLKEDPKFVEGLRNVHQLVMRSRYLTDFMATRANAEWLEDPRFIAAYAAAADISVWGVDIRWRVYNLLEAAEIGSRLPGAFVECGTDRGGTAMAVMTWLGDAAFADRTFYLFDTFEGFAEDLRTDRERERTRLPEGRYSPTYDLVCKTFAERDYVRIVPGAVPQTLTAFEPGPVAFLHIDMNAAQPEADALEFFWPHLLPGAPVVFDDYGFPYHDEQKKTLDSLAERLGVRIILMPTGQGMLIRPNTPD